MTPALVIFDCDGVIVDSEPLTLNLLRDDLEGRGLVLDVSQVTSLFVGGTIASAGVRATELGATIPEGWVPDMYARIYALLELGVDVIPGVLQVMDRLDQAAIPIASHPTGAWPRWKSPLASTLRFGSAFRGGCFPPNMCPPPNPHRICSCTPPEPLVSPPQTVW